MCETMYPTGASLKSVFVKQDFKAVIKVSLLEALSAVTDPVYTFSKVSFLFSREKDRTNLMLNSVALESVNKCFRHVVSRM